MKKEIAVKLVQDLLLEHPDLLNSLPQPSAAKDESIDSLLDSIGLDIDAQEIMLDKLLNDLNSLTHEQKLILKDINALLEKQLSKGISSCNILKNENLIEEIDPNLNNPANNLEEITEHVYPENLFEESSTSSLKEEIEQNPNNLEKGVDFDIYKLTSDSFKRKEEIFEDFSEYLSEEDQKKIKAKCLSQWENLIKETPQEEDLSKDEVYDISNINNFQIGDCIQLKSGKKFLIHYIYRHNDSFFFLLIPLSGGPIERLSDLTLHVIDAKLCDPNS